MANKRPITVWAYTILAALGLLSVFSTGMKMLTLAGSSLYLGQIRYYAYIASLILLVPELIFLGSFFMLKRSCLIWLYISAGAGAAVEAVLGNWIAAALLLIFSWAVWDYVNRKKGIFT